MKTTFKILSGLLLLAFVFVGGALVGTRYHFENHVKKKDLSIFSFDSTFKSEKETTLPAASTPKIVAPTTKPTPITTPAKIKPKKTTPTNKSTSQFTVVVGSFKNRAEALSEVKRIKRKYGYSAFYFKSSNSGYSHRVAIGRFSMKSTATGLRKDLKRRNHFKGALIKKI